MGFNSGFKGLNDDRQHMITNGGNHHDKTHNRDIIIISFETLGYDLHACNASSGGFQNCNKSNAIKGFLRNV